MPMRAVIPWAVGVCMFLAWLQPAKAQGSERERIAAERNAISTLYMQQERDCIQRFATNACVEDVRARRREALAPLRERELNLDEASRHQRADDRRAAVAAKQQAARLRPPPPAEPAPAPSRHEPAGPDANPPVNPPADRVPRSALASAAHASEAAARVQATRQRQDAAKATQARVAQRLAERAHSARRSAPLPSAAASAAGAAGPAAR